MELTDSMVSDLREGTPHLSSSDKHLDVKTDSTLKSSNTSKYESESGVLLDDVESSDDDIDIDEVGDSMSNTTLWLEMHKLTQRIALLEQRQSIFRSTSCLDSRRQRDDTSNEMAIADEPMSLDLPCESWPIEQAHYLDAIMTRLTRKCGADVVGAINLIKRHRNFLLLMNTTGKSVARKSWPSFSREQQTYSPLEDLQLLANEFRSAITPPPSPTNNSEPLSDTVDATSDPSTTRTRALKRRSEGVAYKKGSDFLSYKYVRGSMICISCHRPRCVFSRTSLSGDEDNALKALIALGGFKCGESLLRLIQPHVELHPLIVSETIEGVEHTRVWAKSNLSCHDHVEYSYYSASASIRRLHFPIVCTNCGSSTSGITYPEVPEGRYALPVCLDPKCSALDVVSRRKRRKIGGSSEDFKPDV